MTCAAQAAFMTRPEYSLMQRSEEDSYKYIETVFSGFDASAIFCHAPMDYQNFLHENLGKYSTGITGYSCPASSLPFDEFPGWDDPLTYSIRCRGWYHNAKSKPN